MKLKSVVAAIALASASLTAGAQSTPHSFGLHFGGSTIDLEYQYHFSNKNFVDATAGAFMIDNGLDVTATYNWELDRFGDSPKVYWKWWAGVGAGLGVTTYDDYDGFYVGPAGNLGIGFTGKRVPFTFGVDYRPMFALATGDKTGLLTPLLWNFGLTLTYQF